MNLNATALVQREVRTVDFYGDQGTGAVVQVGDERQVYVPLRPICDDLGLAWSGQFERIKRDAVLSAETVIVHLGQMREGQIGDPYVLCLPLAYLPGWLFSITLSRVRPALRPSLSRYRRDCFRILAAAFPHRLNLPTLDDSDKASMTACPGIVYVVHGGTYFKIGASRNFNVRLRKLSAALPFAITPVCTVETNDMFLPERKLHVLYHSRGQHVDGERFALSPQDSAALKAIPSPLPSARFSELLDMLGPATSGQ